MIFGRTYSNKKSMKIHKNDIWFAWYPIQLEDGRWVWWQKVKRFLASSINDKMLWYKYYLLS